MSLLFHSSPLSSLLPLHINKGVSIRFCYFIVPLQVKFSNHHYLCNQMRIYIIDKQWSKTSLYFGLDIASYSYSFNQWHQDILKPMNWLNTSWSILLWKTVWIHYVSSTVKIVQGKVSSLACALACRSWNRNRLLSYEVSPVSVV
jgi:hypothetical protein